MPITQVRYNNIASERNTMEGKHVFPVYTGGNPRSQRGEQRSLAPVRHNLPKGSSATINRIMYRGGRFHSKGGLKYDSAKAAWRTDAGRVIDNRHGSLVA